MAIDTTADLQTLVNWARNPALSLADRISALNATLSFASSFGWLRAELNSPDLLPIFVAAGATVPALSASIPAAPDPKNPSDNITTVLTPSEWLALARNPAAVQASRLSAITQLIANVVLISNSEAASLGVTAPALYNQTAMVAALNALKAQIQAGLA